MTPFNFRRSLVPALLMAATLSFAPGCDDDDEPAPCTPDTTLTRDSVQMTETSAEDVTLYTDIVIDASADEVWRTLTDWNEMPNWSTSFLGLSGDIRDGGQVMAKFLNQGAVFEVPHTLIWEDGVKFGWADPTGPPEAEPFGGFVDEHIFMVAPISACQTRFIHSDRFQGAGNATFNAAGVASFLAPIYQGYNEELKAAVER